MFFFFYFFGKNVFFFQGFFLKVIFRNLVQDVDYTDQLYPNHKN